MLRATLKSLLSRKLRLLLSMAAVVLSVTFVSASFVLTDTLGRSFDALFANVYTYTDIEVSPKPRVDAPGGGSTSAEAVPAPVVDKIRAVPGVSKATGQVFANGARVLGKNGKLVPNQSGQRFGASWVGESELIKLAQGRAPTVDTEVVVNRGLATAGGFKIGDTITLLPLVAGEDGAARPTFTLVGIFEFSGGRESLGGEQTVFFTEPVAQKLMLGQENAFNLVDVRAADGVALPKLRDDLRAALGADYLVETGPELAKKSAAPFKTIFKFVNYLLLGFAAIAGLVGIFLILNTFSIIVAQRTRELALLRAMGASENQILGSVLLEAVIVGVLGSTIGFLAGIGLGAAGAAFLAGQAGSLKVASIGVPVIGVVLSFSVGITVTILAALIPAVRAASVPPVAAMREAVSGNQPLTRLSVAGGVILAAAVGALVWGLRGAGGLTIWLILGGVLGVLIGVAMLTPLISRPVVSLLGAIFAWSVPGKLGRRNSARNPRRTAITAAAVMIGIAIITAISTVFTSLSAGIGQAVDRQLQADLIVAGQQTSEIPPTMSAETVKKIRQLPEVGAAAAVSLDFGKVQGKDAIVFAYDDLPGMRTTLKREATSGSIDSLGRGQVLVDETTAKSAKVSVGQAVRIQLPKGAERSFTVVGITGRSDVNAGWVISWADANEAFRVPQPVQAYIDVRAGTSTADAKRSVERIVADEPEVTVQTRKEFVGQSTQIYDIFLTVVQVLLLVAMAISVLGVINTLVLSVLERTRELGMLRAIGLRRSQTMRMITVESMVVTLFGTVLGLAVGLLLGAATVTALREAIDFDDLAVRLPFLLIGVYLVASVLVGVVAAVIPSVRAARLNVLNAIAYE
jgi:putative ABC transport system permease protein